MLGTRRCPGALWQFCPAGTVKRMATERTPTLRLGTWCLVVVGAGILSFGVLILLFPSGTDLLLVRTYGLAATGLGFFSVAITLAAFRHRQRWAWSVLWFLPVFWACHLLGGLPPGTDHIHQILFLTLWLLGLLLPFRCFFPGQIRDPRGRATG